jgi:hypothetical protein
MLKISTSIKETMKIESGRVHYFLPPISYWYTRSLSSSRHTTKCSRQSDGHVLVTSGWAPEKPPELVNSGKALINAYGCQT